MRRALLCAAFCLLLPGVVVGGPAVDKVVMISGESYELTYDLGDETLDNVTTNGPMSIDTFSESSGEVFVTVTASEVPGEREGTVRVRTDSGSRETSVTIVPRSGQGGGGEGDAAAASRWQKLDDQWVNQRVNRVDTGEGTLIVYEQRDPTKGDIDPESGIPEGEWVQVPVDEEGNPEWIYETPQGALEYMAVSSNTRYAERTRWVAGSLSFVLLALVTQLYLLPKWRSRQEEKFMFGE